MANVLPPENLQKVWRCYRARFLIVGSLFALALALVAFLALMPSYFLLWSDSRFSVDSQAISQIDEEADRAELARSQALLSELAPAASATTSPVAALSRILSARPKGIAIYHLAYATGKQNTIVLGGTASTREAINTFRKSLEGDPAYKSVSVPFQDLIGTSNQFNMTIVGNF